jgi:hypothetical protein
MGMSPEGIIFFGYHFGEGEIDAPDIHSIATERAQAKGAVRPDWSSCPRQYGPLQDAWYAEHRTELDDYFAAVNAEEKALGDIYWGLAGSYDYGLPYLCIDSSRMFTEWAGMKVIPYLDPIHEGWEDVLNNHLIEMGIPVPDQGPQWYLTAFYG